MCMFKLTNATGCNFQCVFNSLTRLIFTLNDVPLATKMNLIQNICGIKIPAELFRIARFHWNALYTLFFNIIPIHSVSIRHMLQTLIIHLIHFIESVFLTSNYRIYTPHNNKNIGKNKFYGYPKISSVAYTSRIYIRSRLRKSSVISYSKLARV